MAVCVERVQRDVLHAEVDLSIGRELRGEEVLDDLVLRVNSDGLAAGQVVERDPMREAVEAQVDAVMDEAFALEALADPRGRRYLAHERAVQSGNG